MLVAATLNLNLQYTFGEMSFLSPLSFDTMEKSSRHSTVSVCHFPPTSRTASAGTYFCRRWHICLFTKDFDTKLLLPSTQAGLALVVPAIWPFLQAQRAVCRAMVLRGWLLSLSNVTISHVPAANWPIEHRDRVTIQRDKTSVTIGLIMQGSLGSFYGLKLNYTRLFFF